MKSRTRNCERINSSELYLNYLGEQNLQSVRTPKSIEEFLEYPLAPVPGLRSDEQFALLRIGRPNQKLDLFRSLIAGYSLTPEPAENLHTVHSTATRLHIVKSTIYLRSKLYQFKRYPHYRVTRVGLSCLLQSVFRRLFSEHQ